MNKSMMVYYRFDFFQYVGTCLFHKVSHLFKTYLLIKGLKLLKGILKSV